VEGTLTTWNTQRGFGFITYQDHGTQRAFVHINEIAGDELPDVGDRLQFDVRDTPKGIRALNVERLTDEGEYRE
jgi:CspA family cold shock protein